jgi:hypothetical protein
LGTREAVGAPRGTRATAASQIAGRSPPQLSLAVLGTVARSAGWDVDSFKSLAVSRVGGKHCLASCSRGVALAGPAHGPHAVDHRRLDWDEALLDGKDRSCAHFFCTGRRAGRAATGRVEPLRASAGMAAICAHRTAGVDVKRSSRIATADVALGGFCRSPPAARGRRGRPSISRGS